MSTAARVEGFWWARVPGGTWEVGEVYNYPDFIRGASGRNGWLRLRSGRYMLDGNGGAQVSASSCSQAGPIVFGSYVGREPGEVTA
jgi:hypothetical protein